MKSITSKFSRQNRSESQRGNKGTCNGYPKFNTRETKLNWRHWPSWLVELLQTIFRDDVATSHHHRRIHFCRELLWNRASEYWVIPIFWWYRYLNLVSRLMPCHLRWWDHVILPATHRCGSNHLSCHPTPSCPSLSLPVLLQRQYRQPLAMGAVGSFQD